MANSKIEWTEKVWNPVTGCTPISPGCANCYAKRMANRLRGRYGYDKDEPFNVTTHYDKLRDPFHWKKSRHVFVCSMGDLFHQEVAFAVIDKITATIAVTSHTYQILTKRPARMAEYMQYLDDNYAYDGYGSFLMIKSPTGKGFGPMPKWPIENLWLGVSCENQEWANERIPILLKIPAAVRFVSLEPLLGPIDLSTINFLCQEEPKFWVIIGCESGPKRRPCNLEWVHDIVQQCKVAGFPVFVKQIPINGKVSHDIKQFPKELQIREYPNVAN